MSDFPYIFAPTENVEKEYKSVIEKTVSAFLNSIKDDEAFSGINPYVLRKEVNSLGFLPEKGIGFDETLKKVEETILPSLLRTWSTNYMPHLHSPSLLETISSELLIATYNDSMDSWDQGPSATEIEESVIHGLLKLYGYSEDGDGTFTSGGSQSNISAILMARDSYIKKVLNCDVKKNGLPKEYSKLRLYTSSISHFSMDKASHFLGLGYESVRKLPVNDKCQIDIPLFKKMVEEDIENGLLPYCAVATIGTTDFGSIDNLKAMREVCDKYNMHLHADAAYGSALVMSNKYSYRVKDLSLADSITIDFHKMFLLPISCSVVLVKNKTLLDAFELHADYLNREEDEEDGYINLVGKSMQTTRRFDALKVFMAFQTRGKDGYDALITKLVDNASLFYSMIKDDPDFIVPVAPEISSVVFALKDGDECNKKVRRRLLEKGIVIGQTVMNGRVMLKFTLLNPRLERENFEGLIKEIKSIRDSL